MDSSSSSSYPAHNVFSFDNGVTFSSNFDNGNVARVERLANRPYEFKIWSAPDNMGTSYQSKHCAWFYFVVTGLPVGCVLRIQVVNASNHSGLYKHDMVSEILVCVKFFVNFSLFLSLIASSIS
jgi:hypothetical protein